MTSASEASVAAQTATTPPGRHTNSSLKDLPMTQQPTPRGTDMANLSERLRDMAEFLADDSQSYFLAPSVAKEHAKDLATILDRLTVEGLAGVVFEALPERSAWDGAERREINAEDDRTAKDIASQLLTYITTPSVEESHDQ